MALTLDQYVEQVFLRLGKGLPEGSVGLYRTSIESTLSAALQRVGQRAADDSDPITRARLQKSFALTLSSGEVTTPSTMVANSLAGAYLTLSGTSQPLQYLPWIQDLLNPPPLGEFYFWTVHEGKIKVRTSTGAVPSATSLTAYASYYPLVSEVPDEFIDDVIDIGVELMTEASYPPAAEHEAEDIS